MAHVFITDMHIVIRFLSLTILGVTSIASAQTPDVIASWSEKAGDQYYVYMSSLLDDHWSKTSIVAQSDNKIRTPAIGSPIKTDSTLFTVWSETVHLSPDDDRVLKYSIGTLALNENEYKWTDPKLLVDLPGQNLSPSIVYDLANVPWVFWSNSNKATSDIYMIHLTGEGWTYPKMVHDKNTVPDIFPKTYLDNDGSIVVTWNSYSLTSSSYVTAHKSYLSDKQASSKLNPAEESVSRATPPDANSTERVDLHYPKNIMQQSDFTSSSN